MASLATPGWAKRGGCHRMLDWFVSILSTKIYLLHFCYHHIFLNNCWYYIKWDLMVIGHRHIFGVVRIVQKCIVVCPDDKFWRLSICQCAGELVTQPAAGQLVPAAACHPVPSINPQFPALVVFPSTLLFLLLLTSSSSKRHENQTLRLRDTKVSKPGKLFEKLRIPRFTLHRHRDQGVAGG